MVVPVSSRMAAVSVLTFAISVGRFAASSSANRVSVHTLASATAAVILVSNVSTFVSTVAIEWSMYPAFASVHVRFVSAVAACASDVRPDPVAPILT